MRRSGLYLSCLAVAIFGIGFYGCGKSPSTSPNSNSSTGDSGDHDEHDHGEEGHGNHDHGAKDSGQTAMEKMEKGLANLSEADRASAMKQHTCPVTGDMLGTMGEPIKVTVKDQEVWICCDGCKEDLLANPDKYLAKLKR